jgi:protein gp37
MSQKTKIHWCDGTANPTEGCDGCELWGKQRKTCYAGNLHELFDGHKRGTFGQVTLFPGRMAKAAAWSDLRGKARPDKPWLDGLPRLIFVSDMTDVLCPSVSFEYLKDEIIENVVSDKGRRHCWLWLTKRASRMASFSAWLAEQGISWPAHLWVGTSVTEQRTTNRIEHLMKVGDSKTVHFLSVEPQVEPLDLTPFMPQVDWVLHGGESGHQARPFHVEWAVELLAACKLHNVPYFLKQLGCVAVRNGKRLAFEDAHASDWSEWPQDIAVREVPKCLSRSYAL